ncbi:MAG: asparaginase [Bacillota bacterium]
MSVELVQVKRGPLVESIHMGDIAVVDAKGNLIAYAGDPKNKVTYWRSSAKPFQAIPVVESGALERFGIEERELAIFCASHSGEESHVATVRSILKKVGLDESYLQCGSHAPYHAPSAAKLQEMGVKPTSVHCNCSGKHSGMLTLTQQMGVDPSTYTQLDHPVQQAMLASVSDLTDVEVEKIAIGVDGCGVPVFGLPVYNMALAWAKLADPSGLPDKRREAVLRIRQAMMNNPHMVAGTGRTCTNLMKAAPGKIVAKSGAEAVYGFAIPSKGWGFTVKIADGGSRAVGPVVVEALRQLNVLTQSELDEIQPMGCLISKNHRGDIVGTVEASFKLSWTI